MGVYRDGAAVDQEDMTDYYELDVRSQLTNEEEIQIEYTNENNTRERAIMHLLDGTDHQDTSTNGKISELWSQQISLTRKPGNEFKIRRTTQNQANARTTDQDFGMNKELAHRTKWPSIVT